MTMRWDPVLTAAVARELNDVLSGERLKAIFVDHGASTLHAYFREATLLADLDPSRVGLEILGAAEPPEGARPFPCRLSTVKSLPDERVLVLVLPRLRGRGGVVRVVLELVPSRGNAAVVEGDSWTVRHLLAERGGARAPRVGRTYPMPEPSRRGLDTPLSLDEWLALLKPEEPKGRRAVLLRNVAFTSPINAAALLGEATSGGDGADESTFTPDGADEHTLSAGHELWMLLRGTALGLPAPGGAVAHARDDTDTGGAHVMEGPRGPQPYPVCLPSHVCREEASLLDAIRETRTTEGATAGLIPSGLTGSLEDALSHALKRTARLRRELESTPDPEALREKGDLILAHLHLVSKGAHEVSLPGFDDEQVPITLDPALPPPENAARYYDRAGRAQRARERLPDLIRQGEQKDEVLTELMQRVVAGEATAEEIRLALPLKELRTRTPHGASVPALPYRVYRTSGGLEVRVGRGSASNDDLTFRHSKPDDIWLHARDSAGAHVILRWDGKGAPPARDLHEAAVLAALNSKARTSGSVPVDWTHRKHVRKPRKSRPGRVVPDRVKTVFVEPDPTLPARLGE